MKQTKIDKLLRVNSIKPAKIIKRIASFTFALVASTGSLLAQADSNQDIFEPAKNGSIESVTELVQTGVADVDAKNKEGNTPFMIAVHNAHFELAKELLTLGAEIDKKNNLGLDALWFAIYYGHPEAVKFLTNNDADVYTTYKVKDAFFNPVHFAILNTNLDIGSKSKILDLLINSGADVNANYKNKDEYYNSIYLAIVFLGNNEDDAVQIIERLLQAGTNINHVSSYGYTPLEFAEKLEKNKIKNYLLKNGGKSSDALYTTEVSTFIDKRDGQEYKAVKIGEQTWMTENLRTSKFNDGSPIQKVRKGKTWQKSAGPAYCWYDNNSSKYFQYGALYNWHAVNSGKLCPSGWHVPSDEEWKILEKTMGINNLETEKTGWRGSRQGSQLAGSADAWADGLLKNDKTFGKSGFAALPGGRRHMDGEFYHMKTDAIWWTSTEFSPTDAWYRNIYFDYEGISRGSHNKQIGFSVRCVKD